MLPLENPVITLRLNSSSNSSWLLGLKLGTLLKNSHASFFLVWKRCFSSTRVLQNSRSRSNSTDLLLTSCRLIEVSSFPVASTKSLSVPSSTAVLSWARVFDRGRPFRDFPEKLEKLWLAGRGLVTTAWLAEGHLNVARGSGIIVAWGCEPPAPMLGASMCPASSSRPGGWSHTAAVLLLGLSCQFSSQCRCSPYLLGHLVRSLFVLLCLPCVLSPGSSGSIPLPGVEHRRSRLAPKHLFRS